MIVPDYWAEARRQHRSGNRQITVRRFGWSITSAEEALAMAGSRADDALRRLLAGEKLGRREPKVPYNGAAGVPIREEVIARHGAEVITRNAYGARCLNSPRALLADVDFAREPTGKDIARTFAGLAVLAAIVGTASARWTLGLGLLVAALVLTIPLAHFFIKLPARLHGGGAALAKRRLAGFLRTHEHWNVRVYATPAGLRLLATHRPFDPTEPEVQTFFEAVRSDPAYVRMCRNQRCFRARLTAKPWRIGIASHLRPRPGVWPVAPDRMALRAAWIAEYDRRAANYGACRYLYSAGSGVVEETLAPVVALHDRESKANETAIEIA